MSRGESVEIGGSFRVPEVIEQSGARLVDVGTTNRTRLADYSNAIARADVDAAIVLKVHPSNYRVDGFVEETTVAELATLSVPVVVDIGSGLIDATCPWLKGGPPAWLAGEPAARQTVAAGASVVTFSGDKLFGGPQAGIIVGRTDLIERCRRHPLARALRPGGLVMDALQQTALALIDRDADRIPFWRMAATPVEALEARAKLIAAEVGPAAIEPSPMEAVPGAGSAPGVTMASFGVMIRGDHAAALRAQPRPVIARTVEGATLIDLRAVDRDDDVTIVEALQAILEHRHPMTVVATAGHVDHGKSALVLALTGTDPDRLAEEKRRGLTIDLGFAHMTLPSGAGLSFVDVPGHVRFLPNMLAGVGGITGCVFVVAATEGWKPQSEEHLRILQLLGLTHGVIVLTKTDLVDADLLELARLEVADHVAGTFLAAAPVIAVSARTGDGIDRLRMAMDDLVVVAEAAADRGRPRLWVDRVFAAKGSGTVVTGTLVDGSIAAGDHVIVEPGHLPARVRAIEHGGVSCGSIGPGERVALNLASVVHGDVHRGDVVVQPDRWMLTDRFDASLTVLPSLGHDVSRRGAYLAYVGAGEHSVAMRILGAESLVPGTTGAVRIHLPTALPLLPGDRFIIRESGRDETVGGGEVLDIAPVLKAAEAAPDRSIDRVVRERGWIEVDELEQLTGQVVEPTIGRWVTDPASVAALTDALNNRVASAGPLGLDIALLDARERAVIDALSGLGVVDGRLRSISAPDPLAEHPYLAALLAGGFVPPPPDGVDRVDLRELVRRGDVVQRDGICFHRDTISAAAGVVERLLLAQPDGFTMGEFRDATDATRKFCVPLLEELDARGATRRRGDLRIAGPRLAATASPD